MRIATALREVTGVTPTERLLRLETAGIKRKSFQDCAQQDRLETKFLERLGKLEDAYDATLQGDDPAKRALSLGAVQKALTAEICRMAEVQRSVLHLQPYMDKYLSRQLIGVGGNYNPLPLQPSAQQLSDRIAPEVTAAKYFSACHDVLLTQAWPDKSQQQPHAPNKIWLWKPRAVANHITRVESHQHLDSGSWIPRPHDAHGCAGDRLYLKWKRSRRHELEWATARTLIFLDVGAHDFVLEIRKQAVAPTGPVLILATCHSWGNWCSAHPHKQLGHTKPKFPYRSAPSLREQLLHHAFAHYESAPKRTRHAGLEDPTDHITWRDAPGLPRVSQPSLLSELAQPQLKVELTPVTRKRIREEFEHGQHDPFQNTITLVQHAVRSVARTVVIPDPSTARPNPADAETHHDLEECNRLERAITGCMQQDYATARRILTDRADTWRLRDLDAWNNVRATDDPYGDFSVTSLVEWSKVTLHLRQILAEITNQIAIRRARVIQDDRHRAENAARSLAIGNRTAALAQMTRAQEPPLTASFAEVVENVREVCKVVTPWIIADHEQGWRPPPLYIPRSMSCQWTPSDLLTTGVDIPPPRWAAVSDAEVRTQPNPRPLSMLQDWRNSQDPLGYAAWLQNALPSICAPQPDPRRPVEIPDRGLDFQPILEAVTALTQLACAGVKSAYTRWSRRQELIIDITDHRQRNALSITGFLWQQRQVDCMFITDGSGAGAEAPHGPGGFSAICIAREKCFVVLGASARTTSGQMEMAGVLAGLRECQYATEHHALVMSFSDYLSWVQADLAGLRYDGFRSAKYPTIWSDIVSQIKTWSKRHGTRRLQHLVRHHTKAHQSEDAPLDQRFNQLADRLAALAKTTINTQWQEPSHGIYYPRAELRQILTGPTNPAEIRMAIRSRSSRYTDTHGLSYPQLKECGPRLLDELANDFNKEYYFGRMPSYRADNSIINSHRALPKPGPLGGVRNLGAPELAQGIFSVILLRRLILVAVGAGVIPKAQKCNIPKITGCAENITLVMGSLFDFHAGAGCEPGSKYPPGSTRCFFFGDLSKCFDRVQISALIHAFVALFPDLGDITRYLAAIAHLYDMSSILVKANSMGLLIRKLAGVFQGGPDSMALAIILLEYARCLIPPEARSEISIKSGDELFRILAEFDYADDQIRVEDQIDSFTRMIVAIHKSHKTVGFDWNLLKVEFMCLRVNSLGTPEPFDPKISLSIVGGPADKFFTTIGTGATRNGKPVTHAKALGIRFDYMGNIDDASMTCETKHILARITTSPFPIPAKLDAIQTVASKKLEYAGSVVWLDPKEQETLDRIERSSIRTFFNIFFPNAIMQGELKACTHAWRSEVLFLSSIIRCLRSTDRRLRDIALMMTRDQRPEVPLGSPYLSPRFFEWRGATPAIPDKRSSRRGILAYPRTVAAVAARHSVAIWEEAVYDEKKHATWKEIRVAVKGTTLSDPSDILKILSAAQRADAIWRVEERISTDKNKTPVEPFTVAWGLAGLPSRHRKQDLRFIRPGSSYSDYEIHVLFGMRLFLWPTKVREATYKRDRSLARCRCGAIQTATHLLNLDPSSPGIIAHHSVALRNIRHGRHSALTISLMKIVAHIPGLRIVQADIPGYEGHRSSACALIRERIQQARHNRILNLPHDNAQHYKPDAILLNTATGDILVVDCTASSDDKLYWEDFFTHASAPPETPRAPYYEFLDTTAATTRRPQTTQTDRNHINNVSALFSSDMFGPDGDPVPGASARVQPPVLRHLESTVLYAAAVTAGNAGRVTAGVASIRTFKQARYAKRYGPLMQAISTCTHSDLCGRVHLLVVAVGVAGLLPEFSRRAIAKIFPRDTPNRPRQIEKLENAIIDTAVQWALKAYSAWQAE